MYDQIYVTDLTFKASPKFFVDQFAITLWIGFVIAFTCFGIISKLVKCAVKKYTNSSINHMNWFSIATNQGGGGEHPTFLSAKIILFSLSLLVIIFHGAFEAFLSSSLAIRVPDLPFSNLEGLLRRDDYTLCTIKNKAAGNYVKLLNENANSVIKVGINSATCPSYVRNFNVFNVKRFDVQNMEHFPQGKFAYMGFESMWHPYMNDISNLEPIDGKYFQQYITMHVSPGFKFREHFNIGITKARTAGHFMWFEQCQHRIAYFHSGLRRGLYKKIHTNENVIYPIDISQIILILMIPFVGMACSVMVLAMEIIVKKLST